MYSKINIYAEVEILEVICNRALIKITLTNR